MPTRFKDDAPGGMTEEQDKIYDEMEDRAAALEFYKKCQEENLTDEFKAWREERIAKGMYGGAGGLFPTHYLKKDENGKTVMVKNDFDDW